MKSAVIFDMDGVLVDTEPVINEAAILGLKEFGVEALPDDFLPFIGAGEDRYIGGVSEKYGLPYRVEMKARVYELYFELLPDKIRVFDGVHALLNQLKTADYTLGLASSADREKIRQNLQCAGISETRFTVLFSGEDVAHKKPSPDIYLAAAAQMETAPGDCIVIEDAVNGVQAAKAAGMTCIAVPHSFAESELMAAGADAICRSYSNMIDILRNF